MTTVYDVPPSRLIESVGDKLKKMKKLKPPKYLIYAKSGASRENQPIQTDWWYIRCASILRKLYDRGPLGINRLSTVYGSKKNRGMKPERSKKGSGSIITDAVIQLEALELVSKTKRGRIITPQGVSLLDKSAHEIKKSIPELRKY